MNYGFLIDNRSCIGCHACSTACKSENEVPLGVYRTWVKQVEHGAFGEARRHFQVTRCNHCAKPPCVTICPVTAMYKRPDGIVEFDGDVCIGCKACLQACPYDAIYIDPATGTAAKCHYCAHRTDLGLEPACVVVCPTQAIIAGDLDDPQSRISRLRAEHPTSVRRPEQGTSPKLFYIDAHQVTLDPLAAPAPGNMAFTSLIDQRAGMRVDPAAIPSSAASMAGLMGSAGPTIAAASSLSISAEAPTLQSAGPMAAGLTRLTYNAQHKAPWHWQVPAYLVTKAIASGVFMIMVLFGLLGPTYLSSPMALVGTGVALVFLAMTTILLVADLERPERFLRILTRPQWKSWLTRGAFVLVVFSALCATWFVVELGTTMDWWSGDLADAARLPMSLIGLPLALLTAIYTAFLFQQCEGRDLWQNRLMPWQMGVQAIMAGAAVWLLLGACDGLCGSPPRLIWLRSWHIFWFLGAFHAALFLDVQLRWLESAFTLPTSNGRQAHAILLLASGRGSWRASMAWALGAFLIMPIGFLTLFFLYRYLDSYVEGLYLLAVYLGGAPMALYSLYVYEAAIVKAGQDLPNA